MALRDRQCVIHVGLELWVFHLALFSSVLCRVFPVILDHITDVVTMLRSKFGPLNMAATYKNTKAFAHALAERLEREHPDAENFL